MGKQDTNARSFAENIKRAKVNYGPVVFAVVLVAAGLAVTVFCLKNLVETNLNIGNSIVESVAIGVGTLIVVALLYVSIMYFYSKRAHSSFRKAGLVVAVLVASFLIRYAIAVAVEAEATGANGDVHISAAFANALYSAFGGLTFEGMDAVSQLPVWESACYHGVAILAALVFFSSATLALDYPIASGAARMVRKIFIRLHAIRCAVWAVLRGQYWRTAYKNGKPDVYIFDSITQDSVLLAEDIRKSYESERAEAKNGKKFSVRCKKEKAADADSGDNVDYEVNVISTSATTLFYDREEASDKRGRKNSFAFAADGLKKFRAAHKAEAKETARIYDEDAVAWTTGKSCIIIFSGPECEAYDRKNSLHRRIEANNFLYLRYDFGKDIPIARGLQDSTAAYGVIRPWLHCARNIHFFAFSRDESFEEKNGRKYRSEKANAQSVSDEMEALGSYLKEACTFKNHMLREMSMSGSEAPIPQKLCRYRLPEKVCFYILSENDIDYCTYQARLRKISSEINQYADLIIDLKLVNEAERATWKLSLSRHHNLPGSIVTEYLSALDNELKSNPGIGDRLCEIYGAHADSAIVNKADGQIVRILSLGFGDTARKTIGSLYTNTDGNMIVDAIDKNADNIMGAFKRTHPSVLCLPAASTGNIDFGNLEGAVKGRKKISPIGNVPRAHSRHIEAFDYDNLLVINYACRDCLGDSVADYIDICFGASGDESVNYDALIIALGNDELNIACFRSIIMDIRHELIRSSSQTVPTTIFVHIGDEKNAARLYWNQELDCASNFLGGIAVVPYGFKQTVYTFDEIVDDRGALSMHYWYTKESGSLATNRVANMYSEWARASCPDIYKKWSSKVASAYYYTLGSLENAVEEHSDYHFSQVQKVYAKKTLSGAAEHRRWSRFHYINGFERYFGGDSAKELSKPEKDRNLVHNMLCKFSDLPCNVQKYNHANGAQALEWERAHLWEECIVNPNRNLTESEMIFVETMIARERIANRSSVIIDKIISELENAYSNDPNGKWSKIKPQYGVSDLKSWLSTAGLKDKLRIYATAEKERLVSPDSVRAPFGSQILAISPLAILNRYTTSEDRKRASEQIYPILRNDKWCNEIEYDYYYHLLWRSLGLAICLNDELDDIIANAIPDIFTLLLKRGQLSQEFVCKSGDYENFGADVRMPDGVTITRREELLRLYYIWKKRKKSD